MKIAVATSDGMKMSRTFRGSSIIKIFEVKKGKIIRIFDRFNSNNSIRKQKMNRFLDSRLGKTNKGSTVSYSGNGVYDCEVVICQAMDRKNWHRLGVIGKEIIFTSVRSADNAVRKYLSGELQDEYNVYNHSG